METALKRILSVVCAVALMATAAPFAPMVNAATDVIFKETFQSYASDDTLAGWTSFNTDKDGYCWYIYKEYTGNVAMVSASANSSSSSLSTDESLMTPAITVPASVDAHYFLSFDTKNTYPWGSDTLSVYVTTENVTDPTVISSDDCVFSKKLYGGSTSFATQTVSLDAYRGKTVYVVFRHVAKGSWQFCLDNVTVYSEKANVFPVEVETVDPLITITPANGAYTVIDGQDYSFEVNVPSAMKPQNGTLTVTANDEELEVVNGVYTLKNVTKKQEVYVDFAYAAGDVRPDGAINMYDVSILYKGLSGGSDLNAVEKAAGNIDYYDELSVRDAMSLYAYVAGNRTYIDTNKDVSLLWKSTYADSKNGITGVSAIKDADYYINNKQKKDFSAPTSMGDCKQIFYTDSAARVVNLADGYAVTLPFTDFDADYSLSELRSRYESDDFVLNVSAEDQNPYGNTAGGWETYLTEWLNRFVSDNYFLSKNDLSRVRDNGESTTMLTGYTVLTYDILINDNKNIDMPYYHIAVIRKTGEYVKFHLLVMKSKTDRSAQMDTIVKSFKQITAVGTAKNVQTAYECEVPYFWNDETKAYYNKLMTENETEWGFFSASMADSTSSDFTASGNKIQSEYDRLSTALDYDYEIMPTYSHLAWGNQKHYFPTEYAERFAGGNGFNGKPVLQFTYQFTTSNNTSLNSYTPMFDILRGDFDEHFRRLAQDIKAYGKPVLFRLNNEMNTDWTSYAGIVTLLDPDIFVETWEHLYEIFVDEGVDNCIWIFNPVATTTPYCSWGEYLTFMPDEDTVQALGLTSYEMGNSSPFRSFEDHYRAVYEKNMPYFDNYPWIISEFAAGAGGEKVYDWGISGWRDTTLGRNADAQAKWVEEMFVCFDRREQAGYEFVNKIKGAVWFSVNDYTTIGDTNYIVNYLAIDSSLTKTLAAFKKGLAGK